MQVVGYMKVILLSTFIINLYVVNMLENILNLASIFKYSQSLSIKISRWVNIKTTLVHRRMFTWLRTDLIYMNTGLMNRCH